MNASKSTFRIAALGAWLLTLAFSGRSLRAAEDSLLVLLANGNVLRGTAEVQGETVILHRDDGDTNQLRLRRDQVLYTASTLEELYQYRSSKRTSRNSASHIDDAKWCLRHGLIAGAEAELIELANLDPTHPEISRLRRQITAAKQPHAKAPLALPVAPAEREPGRAESAPMPEGISPASVAAFASRVQPLLINRCGNAGCHRTGGDTSWQLSHLGVNVRVSARMTQRNLIAVLQHVSMEDPFSSELLRYSKTPHGNGGFEPTGHTAQSAEATLSHWLSQLGRYPQPLVEGPVFSANAITPSPVAPAPPPSSWPIVQATGTESIREGFTIDANGELIYDPASELAGEADNEIVMQDLVPPGWPAPVIGPVRRVQSREAPTLPSSPGPAVRNDGSQTQPAPSVRPKRLPTIENPFSADLFNRQHQRLSANSLPK